MVARGRLGCFRFAALARLRFAPPEIFAQRRLQPMAPQILVVALFISLAPLIRHLKNPPGIFCQVFGDLISPVASTRSNLARCGRKSGTRLGLARVGLFPCLRQRGACGKNRRR